MPAQRPRGRERGDIQQGGGVHVGNQGLGTGPVGSSDGYNGRKPGGSNSSGRGSGNGGSGSGGGRGSGNYGGGGRRSGGGMSPLVLIIIAAAILLGGGGTSGILSGLLGGGTSSSVTTTNEYSTTYGTGHNAGNYSSGYSSGSSAGTTGNSAGTTGNSAGTTGNSTGNSTGTTGSASDLITSYYNQLFGDPSTYTGDTVSSGSSGSHSDLNETVATGAREKRTKILGGNRDTVTVMIYMCGTDLESRSGMATSDLQEMASASLGDLNIIVYTGGCKSWRNNIISNRYNQIYQVKRGGVSCLVENAGTGSMTDPSTLASFIKWCGNNYPANRNELIFWDHGGGSVSGYGYDEKDQYSGSMSLAGIDKALEAAGVTFDFIGFDACLMATAENALMLDSYGDYLIASEETEPGVGWYYTNWLTALAKNKSMPTLDIGKSIADDFVKVCARTCQGQQTTLSVIDLAEFASTVPPALSSFSKSISEMIVAKDYKTVSNARTYSREFASGTRIDQVDLIDLAQNMGNDEGQKLASALKGAIKYNTTNNISHAYGVSIYFPYKSMSKVDAAVKTYNAIGMDASYTKCIQEFASLETAGQAAMGGTNSPLDALLGGSYSSSSSYGSSDMIDSLLGSFFGGDLSSILGLSGNADYLSGRSLGEEETLEYIKSNCFDVRQLVWDKNGDDVVMSISDEQWELVHELDLNMFYDTGKGYADLGLDNVYGFDSQNRLVADTTKAWLGINGQPVAYYHLSTEDDGENYRITGRIPALLNDEYVNLIVIFDNDHPGGYVAGVQVDYKKGQTDTLSKNLDEIVDGDRIQFICDLYTYDDQYEDTYTLGSEFTVDGELQVQDVAVGDDAARITYRFTDIYNNEYWTPVIEE